MAKHVEYPTRKLDLLAGIATIVDDLECHAAVAFFNGYRYSEDVVATYELPIRADVSGQIGSTRTDILQRLIDVLENLQTKILEAKVGCNEACRAMLLGSLLQGMKKSGIYPRPSLPFPELSLDVLLASLTNGQPKPTQAGTNTASGSTPQRTAGLSGPPQSSRSLFGAPTAPQSTNTSRAPFNFSGPSHSSGNLFGTSTVPQNIISPRESSQSGTGGLFGGKASSNAVPNPPTAESPEQPGTLVKHNYRLKDLIGPLIMAAEKEITGLKLADFPRP
ncbi:uncharacterized protein BKA55DRAFT_546690 [Fusarium redolens]|uniref:Uncharacterized protein n=1 Tax=Fusarium redolens TaxID=48865 RepID=A0A9P9JQG8_FUSRE|nr:uncharacterized protein BKA55DRAFT_546690 [Fusarium redolens]KAH7210853.1 hypothetical protein BKA55DRAFT_546690 [Fusarium redolens]